MHTHKPGNGDDEIELPDYGFENSAGFSGRTQRRDITVAQGGYGDKAVIEKGGLGTQALTLGKGK